MVDGHLGNWYICEYRYSEGSSTRVINVRAAWDVQAMAMGKVVKHI